jgi:hypothetical protein
LQVGSWVSKLVARYRFEGETAFEPRSRRPKTTPNATPAATFELILALRRQLSVAGLDAGLDTIRWHLEHQHQIVVSRATIGRHLAKAGLVTPEPKKRPKNSYRRFEAAMPNETWQTDFTHYRLTEPDGSPGADVEILPWLDDCTRHAVRITAHHRVTGPIVLAEFRQAIKTHGIPASTLTDNGMVFTTRFSGGNGGRNAFEAELPPARHPEAGPTAPCRTARHPHRCSTPCPKHCRATAATPTPSKEIVTTASTTPAASPCESTAACTTSASAEPSPEPTSSCSSRTYTSASPTPPTGGEPATSS